MGGFGLKGEAEVGESTGSNYRHNGPTRMLRLTDCMSIQLAKVTKKQLLSEDFHTSKRIRNGRIKNKPTWHKIFTFAKLDIKFKGKCDFKKIINSMVSNM